MLMCGLFCDNGDMWIHCMLQLTTKTILGCGKVLFLNNSGMKCILGRAKVFGSRKLGADCPGDIISVFAELFLSIHSRVMWLNFGKQNVVCKWVWSSGSQKMIWMILHREMNPKNLQWHGNIPIFTTRKNLGFHPHCWFLGHCVWGGLNTWFQWLMSEMNVSLNRVAQQKISHMARGLLKAWRQKWGGYLVQLSGWSLFPAPDEWSCRLWPKKCLFFHSSAFRAQRALRWRLCGRAGCCWGCWRFPQGDRRVLRQISVCQGRVGLERQILAVLLVERWDAWLGCQEGKNVQVVLIFRRRPRGSNGKLDGLPLTVLVQHFFDALNLLLAVVRH